MRVSQRFSILKGLKTRQKATGKRRRAIRPFPALWASIRSRFEATDDVVSFVSEAASTECASTASPPFILSEIDDVCVLREEGPPGLFVNGHPAPEGSAILRSAAVQLPLKFPDGFDEALDSFFSSPTRRVGFADVVTVVPILSHQLLTKEEKGLLYRKDSTGKKKAKSAKERDFEDSEHCFENAFEEAMFFPNHKGKLIHPAHLSKFVRNVLPALPRDMNVPGFSSFDEYYGVLEGFARRYGIAIPGEAAQPEPVEVDDV